MNGLRLHIVDHHAACPSLTVMHQTTYPERCAHVRFSLSFIVVWMLKGTKIVKVPLLAILPLVFLDFNSVVIRSSAQPLL